MAYAHVRIVHVHEHIHVHVWRYMYVCIQGFCACVYSSMNKNIQYPLNPMTTIRCCVMNLPFGHKILYGVFNTTCRC